MVVQTREQHKPRKAIAMIEERFSKLEKIGSGAYGTVFKARERRNQSVVALKKIVISGSSEDAEEGVPSSTLREVGLLKDLKHPNVLCLLDIQVCESSIYLVLEHLDMDLKKLLERHRKGLPLPLVKSYMWQLLHGLAYCHARRVLHRDLKLQNLLVDRKGSIKLADFGLARSVSLPVRTYTHEVVTLWYRSPELLLKTNHYGPAVDMWSLGCIFAEMQTNRTLFPGESEIDQLYRIFRTLGTPDEKSWPEFPKMPEYRHFANFKSRGVENYIGDHDPLAVDLLSKFLIYNPASRISALTAIGHDYFNGAADLKISMSKIF